MVRPSNFATPLPSDTATAGPGANGATDDQGKAQVVAMLHQIGVWKPGTKDKRQTRRSGTAEDGA